MWMMGYSDGSEFNNMADSFNGRKLRPLVPRPNGPCFRTINGPDLLTFNHHITRELAGAGAQQQQEQVVVSSRWNPTPEQLQTLEELYRRGIRTPSADQIQQITAQLRRFGKIEGKNVFYWFQNHKARERQKRRRQQLEASLPTEENQQQIFGVHHAPERKESGGVSSRTVFEVEQTKNWIPSTNYSTFAEKSISMLEKGAMAGAESCRTDGWVQFHEQREILHHHLIASSSSSSLLQMEKNATWQMMQSPTHHHLLNTHNNNNNNNNNNNIPAQAITSITGNPITTMPSTCSQEDQITNANIWSKIGPRIFIPPNNILFGHSVPDRVVTNSTETSPTLELFPLQGGTCHGKLTTDDIDGGELSSTTPYQFFEFLPLKN